MISAYILYQDQVAGRTNWFEMQTTPYLELLEATLYFIFTRLWGSFINIFF